MCLVADNFIAFLGWRWTYSCPKNHWGAIWAFWQEKLHFRRQFYDCSTISTWFSEITADAEYEFSFCSSIQRSFLPQSYCMSLRSGNWVLMLQWIRWRLRVSGATWVDSMEVKAACLWLREGGGWQQCMEIGGASTGGITNVNLKCAQ